MTMSWVQHTTPLQWLCHGYKTVHLSNDYVMGTEQYTSPMTISWGQNSTDLPSKITGTAHRVKHRKMTSRLFLLSSQMNCRKIIGDVECFSNSLEGVPTYAEHLLAAFPSLCDPTVEQCKHIEGWTGVILNTYCVCSYSFQSTWRSSPSSTGLPCTTHSWPVVRSTVNWAMCWAVYSPGPTLLSSSGRRLTVPKHRR